MSTFSFPEMMKPDAMMKAMPEMDEWMKRLPVASMPPLMAHPMAASAAAMAVGFGMAGQVVGMMTGTMQGALEASRRFGLPDAERIFDPMPGFPAASGTAAKPGATPKPKAATVAEFVPKPSGPKAGASAAKAKPAPSPEASKTAGKVSELKAAADTAVNAVAETAQETKPETSRAEPETTPESFTRPAEMARPERPDDLKRISGIGPKLEQVLNGLGVWTFAQIAGWTDSEVAWVDDYLQFKGRIARDTWQEQAARLAAADK